MKKTYTAHTQSILLNDTVNCEVFACVRTRGIETAMKKEKKKMCIQIFIKFSTVHTGCVCALG